MLSPSIQLDPRRAFRAARALAQDPDDLPQVFTIIESLSADTLRRVHARMRESATGRDLLARRADIVPTLCDRDALRRMPAGSLAHAYLAFVEREGISADGIRAASDAGMRREDDLPAHLAYVGHRLRDTHDLWHAAVGYQGDVLGEAALLGFTLAQTKNPAIGLIVAIGLVKIPTPTARELIFDGYARGKRAAWLPEVAWEELLPLPLEEVRRQLSLGAPPVYVPVRSAELKAAAAAA